VIYFHGLNGTHNQIFQDRYVDLAKAMQKMSCNLLSVELRYHGERRENKEVSAVQNMLNHFTDKQLNPFRGALQDIGKIVDFVEEKKIARPGEIAVVGLAWGATHALYAMKIDPRIRCGVGLLPVCKITGLVEFRQFNGHPLIEQYEPIHFVNNLAPKPLLLVTGEKDTRTNPIHANQLYDKLSVEYKMKKATNRLAFSMLLDVGHRYDSRMTDLSCAWLKKYLLVETKGVAV
jgi:dienelactone hydrolase